MARYKYLNKFKEPQSIPASMYDIVDFWTFIRPDGRIPLFIITEYGILFKPPVTEYDEFIDNEYLNMMNGQVVGFIGIEHYTGKEFIGIIEFFINEHTINQILTKRLKLWEELDYLKMYQNNQMRSLELDENNSALNLGFMVMKANVQFVNLFNIQFHSEYGTLQIFKLHT
jgi:hypothetical protein